MPPTDDPMAALLDPALAEQLDYALLLAYAAGWSERVGDQALAIADPRLAALIEQAATVWHARTAKQWGMPPIPEWLRKVQDAS